MVDETKTRIAGKRILAVDDEEDILETIKDILDEAKLDLQRDYQGALERINTRQYDLAIFDIMGVNGIKLLEAAVARGIPTIMLTAHAVSPDMLMQSIRKGAIAYLPKETLADLDALLNEIIETHETGQPVWKLLFEKLGKYFDERFGSGWQEKDREFWNDFKRTYQISIGIGERLRKDPHVGGRGI